MYEVPSEVKKQIFFVIPSYNEDLNIVLSVLNDLYSNDYTNIVFVDDGSVKGKLSSLIPKFKKNTILLEHIINRGQGAALKTGIDFCLKNKNMKYIVTFDSDGQHRISDLPKFIDILEKDKCDIALGSRFLRKESIKKTPFKKRVLLKGALMVTLFLSSIQLTDTHNGYRVMNKKAASLIDISMDGFDHASEILDEISKKAISYKEIPTIIDYTDYSKEKGQKFSNSLIILLRMIFK